MTIRVAINGFGRIGRALLRAMFESAPKNLITVVAINDPAPLESSAHLLRFDSTHGRFPLPVDTDREKLLIEGKSIRYFQENDPAALPWKELKIDLVLECSGRFTSAQSAISHLEAGARKVLISAPASGEIDLTTVFGINDSLLRSSHTIVSNASCTTNCLAHLIRPLHEQFGIEQGLFSTVHAYTNDQTLIDSHHVDPRRARSATQSIIPTRTGATAALDEVLPEIAGRFDGQSLRVPTLNVSLVDLAFTASSETTADKINEVMKKAADGHLLRYCDDPLVSVDYNHNSASANFDATLTKASGRLVRIYGWYDNEWGYANRLLDTTSAMMLAK